MILGTGIDIIEVVRIAASHEKFGERFLNRILKPAEIAYALSHKNPAPFLAARFAVTSTTIGYFYTYIGIISVLTRAKEAISKAFGTGIGKQLGWQDMEVGRKESGEPFVILHGSGLHLLKERGGRIVHLSLSHTEHYAAAMAILED